MAPVAAGQSRDDAVVLQLRRCQVYRAEHPDARSSQTRAVDQYMLRRVRLFSTDEAGRRWALLVLTPGARRRGEAADSVEVLAGLVPVTGPQLMDIHCRFSVLPGDRPRHPVPPDPLEEGVRPSPAPGPGGGTDYGPGHRARVRGSLPWQAGRLPGQLIRALVARYTAVGWHPLQRDLLVSLGDVDEQIPDRCSQSGQLSPRTVI